MAFLGSEQESPWKKKAESSTLSTGGNRPQEDPPMLAFIHCLLGNPLTHNFILSGATLQIQS